MFSVHRIGVSLQFTAEAVVALLLAAPHSALAGQTTHAPQLTTCGQVQKVTCDAKASHVTTLELKPKSKDQPVTILSTSRGQFLPSPEALYRDTEVCATGRVEMHGRRRRLVVSGPQDIVIRTRLRRPEIPWKGTFFRECDEGVEMPVVIHEVRPNYTRRAMQAHIVGVVALEAVVSTDGIITEVRIRRSVDSKFGLDDEAIKAVTQWRFSPGTRFGQPVPVLVEIELSFRLT